jgi:hypothetical protein
LLATAVVAVMLVVSEIELVVIQRRLPTRGVDEALRQRIDNIKPDTARGVFGTEVPGVGDSEDTFLQLLTGRRQAEGAARRPGHRSHDRRGGRASIRPPAMRTAAHPRP